MNDNELIDAARRYGLPIVKVPCDTAAGRQVATVDLTFNPPKIERKFYGKNPDFDLAVENFTRVCREQGLDLDYGDRPGPSTAHD
jgi:hypothetical protein